jgi:PAS domain S-box-containing protein
MDNDKFREQAENQISDSNIAQLEEYDLEELVHELKVHQVELELQNDELRIRQNELLEAKNKYQALYSEAPIAYFTFNKQGIIIDLNQRGADLLGATKKQLLNKPFLLYLPSDSQDKFHLHRKRVLEEAQLKSCKLVMRRYNSAEFDAYLESTVIPSLDAGDKAIQTVILDITEKKKRKEELKIFRKAIESSSAIIVMTDLEARIEYVNPKYIELTGYSQDELVDENPRILQSGEQGADFYQGLWATIRNGNVWNGVFINKTKHGSILKEKATILPIKDDNGEIAHYLKVAEDFTKESALEQENKELYRSIKEKNRVLEKRNKELERSNRELKETSQQLKKEKKRAEQSNKAKSEFLANMSHEIRTPLNSVVGFSQILENRIDDPNSQDYLNSIKTASHSLLELINDILDMSKIEAGVLEVQWTYFDLIELLEEMKVIFSKKIDDKGLDLILEFDISSVEIKLDTTKLRHILINLIGNAIKFTKEGYVKIIVNTTKNDHGKLNLEIIVVDTGIGIAKKEREKIFESFSQQDGQSTREYGGTGLGLAITKKLTGLMEGRIDLESERGVGSKFSVSFKNLEFRKAKERSSKERSPDLRFENHHVLLVDDEQSNRELLKIKLEARGVEVSERKDGQGAVKLSKQEDFDLIIMDLKMPVMDGYQALKKIREADSQIAVIACTAAATTTEEEKVKQAGFDGFLSKPVSEVELIQELTQYLESQEEKSAGELGLSQANLDPELILELKNQFYSQVKDLTGVFEMGGVDYITKPFHKSEVLARIKTQLELRATKKQLKMQNQEKNILLENIDTQIWYLKSPTRYGRVNSSHAEFLGRAKEEIEGELVADIFAKQDADTLIKSNKKVFASKEKLETKEWIKNYKGKERLLKITKTPKVGSGNNIQYLVCSAEDITANQELLDNLKESKRKFRSYVDYAPDGIFIVDRKGNYRDVNREGMNMLGYSKAELLNMNVSQLVSDQDVEEAVSRFKELIKGGQIRQELQLKKKDGSLVDVILEAKKIAADSFLAFVKDITEKKQAEDSLKRKVELEQLSTELSQEFIDLKDQTIAAKIEEELERIGKFMNVDYAFIYLFSENKGKMERSFEWYSGEFADRNLGEVREELKLRDFPWLLDQLETKELIDISDIDQLSARAKKFQSLLIEQGIKATLIFPLKYNNNLIGALAFDNETKTKWDRDELSLFKVIADIFVNVLQRKKNEAKLNQYYTELEAQKSELERLYDNLESEFEKAKKLHQQFLPTELPQISGISYDIYFQPSQKIGGDFYNLIRLDEQLLFYLADVSGHGLDGAMMDIFLREMINNYLLNQDNQDKKLKPNKLISYVAERYRKEKFPADYFICLLVGVLDLNKMEVEFANAGFQFPPIKITNEGQLFTIDCGGVPISSAVSKAKFNQLYGSDNQSTTINFAQGDALFLTTDGLMEEQIADEMYGEKRVKEILATNYNYSPDLINIRIKNDFENFSGSLVSQDDLTFVTIKRDLEVINRFCTTIKSEIEQLHQVQEQVSEFIALYCKAPELVCIGFHEIVTNAMEHGNQLDATKEVRIEIKVTEKYIKVTITDQGSGFNWRNKVNTSFNLEDDLQDGRERGRGIKITNKSYDQICYNDTGNQVCLLKFRE